MGRCSSNQTELARSFQMVLQTAVHEVFSRPIRVSLVEKSAEREFVQDVIEKLCYVAFDYNTKVTSTADKDNTNLFPHGNIITVGAEIFNCAEPLSQPSPTGQEASGFHDTSFQCIMQCYFLLFTLGTSCRFVVKEPSRDGQKLR